MQVPLLDLKRQYAEIEPHVKEAIEGVLSTQRFIMGPKVAELEERIAAYCGTAHAVACASGSDALLLALWALGVGPGDEVITTPFTFFATGGSISRLGAAPVFVDIEPDTFNMNPDLIEPRITENSKAIMPVHLFGQCADMDRVNEVAARHDLPVIEDAAQAIGAGYRNRWAGSLGAMGAFSFFPTKNLGGYGDGGIVTTDDEALYDMLSILRLHGSRPKYYHKYIGMNSRLDALQAAVLLVKLQHLDRWNESRRTNAALYNGLFEDADVVTPTERPEFYHIYNQYTIRVKRRDELREFLKTKGIGAEIYYPVPLHRQECYAHLGYEEGSLPVSEQAASEVISLPVFPELSREEMEYVAASVREFAG
ncbi:MAG: DegT/DnrJ/EryC1/StrS family aminotransferase [Planctomycetota bacterium]|jgi:dTDP-4-amino-4,6-dideoxygalactose transaminase